MAEIPAKFFWANLAAFLGGVACQVAAVIWPAWQEAAAPVAVLLLSGANLTKVLNGSLMKHSIVFLAGVTCQILAVKIHGAREALFPAAGLLLSAADLPKILSKLRPPDDDAKPPLDLSKLIVPAAQASEVEPSKREPT